MGRRGMKIDKKLFETLCGLQCTLFEIASACGCDRKTIEAWCKREYRRPFKEVFAEKRGRGKISLRRLQWQHAEKSPAMAIFLGKNYLGQSDSQSMEISGADGGPIRVKNTSDLTMLTMGELIALDAILDKVEGGLGETTS